MSIPDPPLDPALHAHLARLHRHYLALSPSSPSLLPSPPFPSPAQLSTPAAQAYLAHHLLDPAGSAGPEAAGGEAWKRVFWRRVVKAIEQGLAERVAEGEDVSDEVSACFGGLVGGAGG